MKAIEKELKKIYKTEAKLIVKASKRKNSPLMAKIEEKIPDQVLNGLQKAFIKAFGIVFEKGVGIIEKTYNKDELEKEYQIHDYAFELKGSRKELKRINKDAKSSHRLNMVVTTAEGMGLGALGIGMPDLVLWLGVVFRGIYETSVKYGFSYDTPKEQYLILKMLEATMTSDENWFTLNKQIDALIEDMNLCTPSEEELKAQMSQTATAFSTELLVIKFIQGLPVIGIFGGMANPVYYQKIMNYVQIKYYKRYLLMRKNVE